MYVGAWWGQRRQVLTVQEAVVLEAAAAEERVEGVHGLVARHALGERPVDVGRALGRQRVRVAAGRQLHVPAHVTRSHSTLASPTLYPPRGNNTHLRHSSSYEEYCIRDRW
jgi:hypothetical protein